MNRFRYWTRQNLFAGALALALVFVQSLGLLHGVSHAGMQQGGPGLLAERGASGDSNPFDSRLFDARHSCSSFEAATLAAALHVTPFAALLLASASLPVLTALPVSRDAPTRCHYLSRAPPSLWF